MGRRIVIGFMLLVLCSAAFPWYAGAQPLEPLRWGSSGDSVGLAQRKLKDWGYYFGSVDGVYGKDLYDAVLTFQRRNGLRVDGVVGPETWSALGETGAAVVAETAPSGATSALRQDDRELLARVISAEAMGEPYEGQVAVGAVMLNRMRDPRFPETLAGIVYQEDAFESVLNGTIYQPATPSSVRAAGDALNGWDPSGGAVFFWNPVTATSPWVWSRPIITQIGDHVFAR